MKKEKYFIIGCFILLLFCIKLIISSPSITRITGGKANSSERAKISKVVYQGYALTKLPGQLEIKDVGHVGFSRGGMYVNFEYKSKGNKKVIGSIDGFTDDSTFTTQIDSEIEKDKLESIRDQIIWQVEEKTINKEFID